MKREANLLLGLAFALTSALLPACSSDDSNSNGTGKTADSGSTVDAGDVDATTPDSSTSNPIVDASLNFDVALSCTKPSDCADAGEVCCGSASATSLASMCQSSCNSGQSQVCVTASDCPSGDSCPVIPILNVGICQPGTDSGPVPDSGGSATDAGTEGG